MAFDGAPRVAMATQTLENIASEEIWRRDQRLVVLAGGIALGALAGFFITLTSGRFDVWLLAMIAMPLLALDLYLAGKTMSTALQSQSVGCATACGLHAAAVLAWPMTALMIPLSPLAFWSAPALALTALVLFASCWSGEGRALYRMAAQGALVAALMAQQGVFVVLGG